MRLIPIHEHLWINVERIIDIRYYNGKWKVYYDRDNYAEVQHDISGFIQMLNEEVEPLVTPLLESIKQKQELVCLLDKATQQIKEMKDTIALREVELMALRHSMRLE